MGVIINSEAVKRVVERLGGKYSALTSGTVCETVVSYWDFEVSPGDELGKQIIAIYQDEAGLRDNWRQRLFVLAGDLGIRADATFSEKTSATETECLLVTMPNSSQFTVFRIGGVFRVTDVGWRESWDYPTIDDAAQKLFDVAA